MRCRKVRSFLSAYCKDELGAGRRLAIGEHLSNCSSCRRQEAIYRSMNEASSRMPDLRVSDDFNTRLLHRVAQERFAETRTKAYLPRPAPLIAWGKVIPVLTTVCLVALVAVVAPRISRNVPFTDSADRSLDDSYLTAQPIDNPNLTIEMDKDWSLSSQLARVERVSRISNAVTRVGSFGRDDLASRLGHLASRTASRVPYRRDHYTVRPVVRIYLGPETSSGKEAAKVY